MVVHPREGVYRDAAPPKPLTFPLGFAPAVQMSLLSTLASVVVALLVVVATSVLVVAFIGAGFVSLLNFLSSGVPMAIEVHHDRVVIRYLLRKPIELHASRLRIQRTPDILRLETDTTSAVLELSNLRPSHRDACCAALQNIAVEYDTTTV